MCEPFLRVHMFIDFRLLPFWIHFMFRLPYPKMKFQTSISYVIHRILVPLFKTPRVSFRCHKKDIILSEDVDLQQLAQSLERYSGCRCSLVDGTMLEFFGRKMENKGVIWVICVYGCWTKNRGVSPKMDGENNGKPYFLMDDLGGKPTIFGNIHIFSYS